MNSHKGSQCRQHIVEAGKEDQIGIQPLKTPAQPVQISQSNHCIAQYNQLFLQRFSGRKRQ
ncbi:hypothetical protein NXY15_04675 [Bacteroides thetaiotaomicron]|nr:hypothetical protein NXY15_04675 [Bacteroides thetaiotaomicron]